MNAVHFKFLRLRQVFVLHQIPAICVVTLIAEGYSPVGASGLLKEPITPTAAG